MTLKVRVKKNAAKYGEAIIYLPLDASGADCTALILVAMRLYDYAPDAFS